MTWQLLDVSVPWLRILCLHQDGCVSTTGPLLHIARVLLSTLTIWMKMKPSSKSSQKKIAAKRYRDPKMYQVTSSDSSVVHDAATCLVTTVISLLIGALSVCGCSSFHFQCLNLPFGRKRDGEKIFKRFFSQESKTHLTKLNNTRQCLCLGIQTPTPLASNSNDSYNLQTSTYISAFPWTWSVFTRWGPEGYCSMHYLFCFSSRMLPFPQGFSYLRSHHVESTPWWTFIFFHSKQMLQLLLAHDLGWLQQIVSWMPQLFGTSSPYIISQISCPYTSLHDDSTYQQSATHRNQTVPINFVPITLEIPLSYDDIGCKCSLMKTTMGQCWSHSKRLMHD